MNNYKLFIVACSVFSFLTLSGCGGANTSGSDTDTTVVIVEDPQAKAEKIEQEYRNFSTPAIECMQAKGHVKSIVLSRDKYNVLTVNFDKDGNITNISTRSADDKKNLACKLQTNDNGTLAGFSYKSQLEGLYPDEGKYRFSYAGSNMVSAVSADVMAWEGGADIKYVFSDFDEEGLPLKMAYDSDGGAEGTIMRYRGTYTIKYTKTDDYGNWTAASFSAKLKYEEQDEAGDGSIRYETENDSYTLRRTIIYYTKEELGLE